MERMNRGTSADVGAMINKGEPFPSRTIQRGLIDLSYFRTHHYSSPRLAHIHWRDDLLWCKLRFGKHFGLFANDHQDFWVQCVLPCGLMEAFFVHILVPANALAQLLTVPPYAVAAIVLCMTSYTSDRIQNRGLAVAGACAVGAIGMWHLV
jgi:hypothetical protein